MKSKILRIIALLIVFLLSSTIAFLSVAVAFVSFFGIDSHHGDIETVYVTGLKDLTSVEGVEVTFIPDTSATITNEDIENAKSVIETRLVNNNITNYEVKSNNDHNILVTFPNNDDYITQNTIKSLSETAMLRFCVGHDNSNVILEGSNDIKSAQAGVNPNTSQPMVTIEFTEEGTKKFAIATQTYLGQTISIWIDNTMISAPTVVSVITNGQAVIDGMESAEDAVDLANKINAGSLPFALSVYESSIKTVKLTMPFESYASNVIILVVSIIVTIICFIVLIADAIIIIVSLIPRKKTIQV